jgi:hypothetical protein
VERTAETTGWVKRQTADILGISRPTLDRWIEDFHIVWPPKGARPRFERTRSQCGKGGGQPRRAFQIKLPISTIDWLRHRAIDKRVPASRIVEEALQLFREHDHSGEAIEARHLEDITTGS